MRTVKHLADENLVSVCHLLRFQNEAVKLRRRKRRFRLLRLRLCPLLVLIFSAFCFLPAIVCQWVVMHGAKSWVHGAPLAVVDI
jgi:hypothetical protein